MENKGFIMVVIGAATGPYPVPIECSSLFPWCTFVGLFMTQFMSIIYIRILLICHPWDQTVASFSKIFCIFIQCLCLTKFLQAIMCSVSIFGQNSLLEEYSFWMHPSAAGSVASSSLFFFLFGGGVAVQFLPMMLKDQESL